MRLLFVFAAVCLISAACTYETEDSSYDLAPDSDAVKESLLDLDAAHKARRASYQSNVGTVYTHLNEIIRKILVHKKAWSVKYESDLSRVAKELADHLQKERNARKAKDTADNKLAVAKAEANRKNSAWTKAHAKLNQKKKDVAKERADLKVIFESGNGMKAGEIAMIVKIRCMLSQFNKDGKYKCGSGADATPAPAKAPAKARSKRHYEEMGEKTCEEDRLKADGTPVWHPIASEAECKARATAGGRKGYKFSANAVADASEVHGCAYSHKKKMFIFSPMATGKCGAVSKRTSKRMTCVCVK